ncbi:hypothetical protein BR63_00235 [Thermanaerosceptrum fracticalcis]|jgi:hypothetical protein|uniref:Peptidase C39-like domain-containing protein n=1 Tax=Thermanaerosceptrum fracticalcis TaxID=1712410 RepID=A0A7G6DYI9_THEFR|nr:hypothetical protein [Thermanaerosceptrum fracticalcis]QNB44893.1 hypothetical protein BR63_00235 [Thermanaerosceptrum fracticalcis]
MKKFICVLVLFIMVFGATVVYGAEQEMINLIETNDEKTIEKAAKEESKQWQKVMDYINKQNNKSIPGIITPKWIYPVSKSLFVPLHTQQTHYWCGPASTLAIIDYNGRAGQVSGSTEYQKQNTIATQSGTTNSGSNTLNLRNTLNNYVSNIHYFNVKKINGASGDYDALFNLIDYNIFNLNQPVMVLVKTSYLPYRSYAVGGNK